MEVLRPPELPELAVIRPDVHGDARGFFVETFHLERYREVGIGLPFVQDNLSVSGPGILRGLHFQHPHAQGKLVRVVEGEVFDVAVDIRVGSPRFGRWFGARLTAESQRQLWIPPDFAHGFVTLGGGARFSYKCTDHYHPECDHTLRWDDPAVGIEWPLETPELSAKDRSGSTLAELEAAGLLPVYAERA